MEFFSGLDVSMERTAICVVDDQGEVQMQTEVVTDPDAIAAALTSNVYRHSTKGCTMTHALPGRTAAVRRRCW